MVVYIWGITVIHKGNYNMKKIATITAIAYCSLLTSTVSFAGKDKNNIEVREIVEVKQGEPCSDIIKRTKHPLSLETCLSMLGDNNPGGSLVFVVSDRNKKSNKSPYSGIFTDGRGWAPVSVD